MFKRSGNAFLGTYAIALFALLFNFALPASIAIAAEDGQAGYLLEICTSNGVKAIRINDGEFANNSAPRDDKTIANYNLCSYCTNNNDDISVDNELLFVNSTIFNDNQSWFVITTSNIFRVTSNLTPPVRAPPIPYNGLLA